MAELERKVGQQTLEIDFLKECLQRIEEQRMLQAPSDQPPKRLTVDPRAPQSQFADDPATPR